MKNLFEIVPGNFFSVLSSKNKEIYVDALMLLHDLFQDKLNIEVSDFVSAVIGLLEDRAYELEEDEAEAVPEGGLSLSAKARLILDRLVMCGWVDREYMDGSFTEVITPRDYAIKVMRLIYDLGETSVQEYNSLVFSTYSGLKQAQESQQSHMYEAVLNAKSNTEKLAYELRIFYHGIRSYLLKIRGQSDINTLLSDHFNGYKALTDRIYHPIKTMDSIHRYSSPIQEILNDVLGNPDMMDNMRKRAMAVRKYESEDEAGREIILAIDFVLGIYQTIGGIMGEIDKKHNNYTKISIDTIRYQMTADQTIAGKLTTLLKTHAASSAERQGEILRLMERGVHANRQEFFDGRSLWHKSIKSRRSPNEPLTIDPGGGLSEEEVSRLFRFLDNDYSIAKIKEYMDGLMMGNDFVSSVDIEIEDDIEFVMLLLSTIRAGERNTGFRAQVGTGSVDKNGYRIPEITFTRKT